LFDKITVKPKKVAFSYRSYLFSVCYFFISEFIKFDDNKSRANLLLIIDFYIIYKKDKKMSRRIRKGDKVIVLSGSERNKQGEVLSCSGEFALVQGINMRTSFIKKNQQYPQGMLLRKEAPIRLCKLRVCNSEGVAVKLRARLNDQGEKELYYIQNGESVIHRNMTISSKKS